MRTAVQIPEIEQVVQVRTQKYIVTDLVAKPKQNPIGELRWEEPPLQHLVTLSCLDDGRMGEALEVIWELEIGARIIPANELPTPEQGFDTPEQFVAYINAVNWGIISAEDTDILQAPFRSGIEVKDYQLDPLVRSLTMPRVNLLIADDVGLGKTIETGMVIQEMLIRGRASNALIVCPSGLQQHWKEQMAEKFGLEFRIIDREALGQIRRDRGIHVNPWTHYPRLITSIDYLKRNAPMRKFKELLPKEGEIQYPRPFDLLIIDEAHNIAPSMGGTSKYSTESLRTRAIRTIAPHFEHKLFLSATPHNGYKQSFTSLLELLDNQRFSRSIDPNPDQLQAVMVRRLKSDLIDSLGNKVFKDRQLKTISVDYTDAEIEVHNKLLEYGRIRAEQLREDNSKYAADFLIKLLKKRLFSSPRAFANTLKVHLETMTAREADEPIILIRQQQNILQRKVEQLQQDSSNDEELMEQEMDMVATASRSLGILTEGEKELLQEMINWAEQASQQGDSKLTALLDWIREIVKPNGNWNKERIILFTEFRDTQKWLLSQLQANGLDEGQIRLIYGGMDAEDREAIKAEFQSAPEDEGNYGVRILLATDAASEGIDLQNHCHRLLHIEIPWNPNRMEQRNGRIDRHGQQFAPEIFHFVPAGFDQQTITKKSTLASELEFLMRVATKVNQIREDLGSVGPVLADQVAEAMAGKRSDIDTRSAEANAQTAKRILRAEKLLKEQVATYYTKLLDTQEQLNIHPDKIFNMVQYCLGLLGEPLLTPIKGQAGCYHLPDGLSKGWQRAYHRLYHPHTKQRRPITFDTTLAYPTNALGKTVRNDQLVHAHLNHPLVQQAIRILRAEISQPRHQRKLQGVTAMQLPRNLLPEGKPAVLGIARMVITGGDHQRLHEELIVAGGSITIDAPRPYKRIGTVSAVDKLYHDALTAGIPATPAQQEKLQKLWDKLQDSLYDTLKKRGNERATSYEKKLLDRAEKQCAEIETILTELLTAIKNELDISTHLQGSFEFKGWKEVERQELRKDVTALEARRDAIPVEIEQEKERIQKRVLEPHTHNFPVGVLFLVPKN